MNGARIKFGWGLFVLILAFLTGCASPSPGLHEESHTGSDLTDVQKRAALRLQLAIGYYEQKQLKVALNEIRQAIAIDPRYGDAYSMRGLIYMEMGDNRLAEDNFRQALKISPGNPDYSNNYGWFLCQNGREKESIPYFEVAYGNSSYRSPVTAYNNAGICSFKMQQENEALKYLLRAFQLDSSHPVTNVYLSSIYADRADRERARFYLNRLGKADFMTADVLLMGIKTARKLGDRSTELSMVTQLRRRHADSPEYAAYQREALHDR